MKTIGFTKQYYTLWEVTSEDVYTTINGQHRRSGTKVLYTYYQNLSKDEDKAKERFEEITGEKAPEVNTDLFGRNSSFENFIPHDPYDKGEFPKGKYTGKKISECTDIKYLLWAYNDMLEGDNKGIAKEVLMSAGYVDNVWGDGLCTVDELEEQLREKEKAELEKSIIRGFNFTDGEKVEIDVTVHSIGGFNGFYGYTYIFAFLTDDKRLVLYKGSKSYPELEEGDKVTIKGTIKHNSYYSDSVGEEVKETKILRMKVIK